MIAIKDMKMPEHCRLCQFARFYGYAFMDRKYECALTVMDIDILTDGRPDWCPLREVKDNETD